MPHQTFVLIVLLAWLVMTLTALILKQNKDLKDLRDELAGSYRFLDQQQELISNQRMEDEQHA
ncbi:MAG: hypothetical protein RBQ91_02215 [Acholeplasma sp.]|nr:hypothetical protein [Acholeplasma sp.]